MFPDHFVYTNLGSRPAIEKALFDLALEQEALLASALADVGHDGDDGDHPIVGVANGGA